ncbi:hypothetical protein B0T20DRAFT_489080 [Sordaria brevicollis]|uniref:Uncharacterized protein n=1 Tax=Sordaria brevicollis TaxID=83679 RepID=A0AAE0U5N8_SORBR|nr:hypothetical protein B0T20DRAFT_489080 [Sordaria brevicollis]
MSKVRRFWKIFHCHICGGDVKAQLYCPSCGHPFCRSCQREVVAEENVTKVVTLLRAPDSVQSVDPSPNTVKPPMPTEKPTQKLPESDPEPDKRPSIISSAAGGATTVDIQKAYTLEQAKNASRDSASSHDLERPKIPPNLQDGMRPTSSTDAQNRSSSNQHASEEFSEAITQHTRGTPPLKVTSAVRNIRNTHSASSKETHGTLKTWSPSPVHPPKPQPLFLPPRTMAIDARKTPDTRRWISPPKPVADVTPSPPLPAHHVHTMRPAQPAVARQFSAVKRQARKLAQGPSSRASEESPAIDVEAVKSTSGSGVNVATRYHMPKVKVSSPPLWLKSPSTKSGVNPKPVKRAIPAGVGTRTGSVASTATTRTFITGDSGRTDASVSSHAIGKIPERETVTKPYFSPFHQQEHQVSKQPDEFRHDVYERQEDHGDYQHSGDFHKQAPQHGHGRKVSRKVSEDLKARILSLPVSEQSSKSSKGNTHRLQADNKAGLTTVINRISEMQSDRSTYSGRSLYSGRSTHSGRSTPATIRSVVITPKPQPGRAITPGSEKGGDRRDSQNRTPTLTTARSSGSHIQEWQQQQQRLRSSPRSSQHPTHQRAKRPWSSPETEDIRHQSHNDATGLSSLPSRSSETSYQSRDALLARTEHDYYGATATSTKRESETAPLLRSTVLTSAPTAKTIGNRPQQEQSNKFPISSSSADVRDHRGGLRGDGGEEKTTSSGGPPAPNVERDYELLRHNRSSSSSPSQEIVRQAVAEAGTSTEGNGNAAAGCTHDPGQGIQGLTIVLHLKGHEDLVISTDLTREGSAVDGASSVTISLSPIVPLSPQSPNSGRSGRRVASPFRIL